MHDQLEQGVDQAAADARGVGQAEPGLDEPEATLLGHHPRPRRRRIKRRTRRRRRRRPGLARPNLLSIHRRKQQQARTRAASSAANGAELGRDSSNSGVGPTPGSALPPRTSLPLGVSGRGGEGAPEQWPRPDQSPAAIDPLAEGNRNGTCPDRVRSLVHRWLAASRLGGQLQLVEAQLRHAAAVFF